MTTRPGQTLAFLAGFVPGVDQLDVKKVLSVKVSMDAERFGGSSARTLATDKPYNVTVPTAGNYPVHWTVAFVVGHGHNAATKAVHTFDATIVAAGTPMSSGGGAKGGATGSGGTPPRSAGGAGPTTVARPPATTRIVTAAPALPSPAPTITLPADRGGTSPHPARTVAYAPLANSTDTYLFTAFVGTLVIGALWLLWVASIKPILGR